MLTNVADFPRSLMQRFRRQPAPVRVPKAVMAQIVELLHGDFDLSDRERHFLLWLRCRDNRHLTERELQNLDRIYRRRSGKHGR